MTEKYPHLLRFSHERRTLFQTFVEITLEDWPPPERLWLITVDELDSYQNELGVLHIMSDEEVASSGMADVILEEGLAGEVGVTPFYRHSYSKIADADVPEMAHVMRGAEFQLTKP